MAETEQDGTEETRVDALETLNAGRRAVGLEPLAGFPAGVPEDSENCPLAVAVGEIAQAVGAESAMVDGLVVEFYAEAGPRLGARTAEQVAALSWAWGEVWWSVEPDEAALSLPDALQAFIGAFDAGAYPDLVLA